MRAFFLLLAAALAGCAGTPYSSPAQTRVAVDTAVLEAHLALEAERREAATAHFAEATRLSDDPELAERATRMAHELGLTDLGLDTVRRWQTLAPEDARAHWFEGVFQTRQRREDRAVAAFERLITGISPGAPDQGLALVVEALTSEPNTADTTRIMRRLTERFPGTAEGHFGLARLALRSGDFELALENAEAAIELDPDWLDAELLYARTLLVAGRTDEALALGEQLANEYDDVPPVQLQYAELLLSAGRSERAEARLNAILDDNPGMPEAIRALAFLTLTTEQYEESEGHFNALRTNEDYRDEAFYYLGRIAEAQEESLQATRSYSRVTQGTHAVEAQIRTALIILSEQNDRAGALRHLEEFGNANPRFSSEMMLARGQLLLQAGEPERAMQLVDDALSRSPDDAALQDAHVQLHVILAQDAMDRGRLDEAEQRLEAGLERYPQSTSLRYSRALLLQRQGRMRRSADVLEALVEDSPNNAAALNALGYLLTDQFDRHAEAREYIQRALAMDPDSPAIIDSMGWVLYHLGEHEAALDYLERAYRLEADPEIAAHLVDVHLALGQHEQARQIFTQAIERAPESLHLQEVRQRIEP